MKYIALILLLASCTTTSPQLGYREARGYEGSSGFQTGAGIRATHDAGPVTFEGSVMTWTDHGTDDRFVNRSTNDIEAEAFQASLGVCAPIAKGNGWQLTLGGGFAYQRADVMVDLDYAGSASDTAEEWAAYGEIAYRRSGWFIGARMDEPLDMGQSLFTTEPGGRGPSLTFGLTFGN